MNAFTTQLYAEAYADKTPEEIAALRAIEVVIRQRSKALSGADTAREQNGLYLAYQDARGAWASIANMGGGGG